MSSSDVAIAHEGKTSWPELVGKPVEVAKAIIHRDRPDFEIVVLLVGTPVTKIFNPTRVRVYVNRVTRTPQMEAEEIILKDNPDKENVVLPEGMPVTEDININHSPPFVGIVVTVPHIG